MAKNSGIDLLLGDQRKGIIALAIPLGLAMLIQQINSLVDTLWVAGLGSDAMAAVGIVSPIYVAVVGIGSGLGIGISAAIARYIGKSDKARADEIAGQGLLITAVLSVILTVLLLIAARPLLALFGAGDTIGACLDYAVPLFIGTAAIMLCGVLSGMLRGEGAAKRSMIIQCAGAFVNMILDPVLIYTFGMGVSGAAWATVAAMVFSAAIPFVWYCMKKDTYITLRKSALRYNASARKDIMSVGLPEMLELSIMSFFNILLNYFIIICGGTDAVGIFSALWKVIYLGIVPAQAIGGALVSVCSAEYGMRRFDKIGDAFRFSVRTSMIAMVVIAAAMALLADIIASVFTMSEDLQYMHGEFRTLVLFGAVFMPAFSLVYTGSSLMQSLRKAGQAMVNTFLRNVLIAVLFAAVAFTSAQLDHICIVLTVGELVGGAMMFLHARVILGDVLRREGRSLKAEPAQDVPVTDETRVKGVKSMYH